MKTFPTTFARFLFAGVFILLQQSFSYSQSTGINYTYSTQAYGAWAANGGAVIAGSPGADNTLFTITPPPGVGANQWNGFFFGSTYFPPGQPIYISSNGFMSFINPGSSIPTNSLATSPYAVIAPLWDDLAVAPAGNINWRIVGGGSPNRKLVVEWNQMLWDKGAAVQAITMQVTIWEKTAVLANVIDIKYLNNGAGIANINNASSGASVGLSGFCSGDFYSYASVPGAGAPVKTAENTTLASHPSTTFFYRLTPNVHPNDNCASAQAIVFNPASFLIPTPGTTLHSTISAAPAGCWGAPITNAADVWFTFTKPAGITNFEIFTDSLDCRGPNYKTGIEVYTSCGGAPVACNFGSAGPSGTASSYLNMTNASFGVPCASQQYWVRVATDTTYKGYFRFYIRPPGRDCAFATNITPCGIPYTAPAGLSTCGFANDYDSINSLCHHSFQKGEDYVFTYTPPVSQCVDFHLNNTPPNSFPGLFIYDGCPNVSSCLGIVTGLGGTNLIFSNFTLSAGVPYYFVVDYDSSNFTTCLSMFDFSISTSLTSAPGNDLCASAPVIPVNVSAVSSCTGVTNYNNSCATPSAAGIPLPGCGAFTDGVTPDVWFTVVSNGTTSPHQINVNPGSPTAQDLAMAVYTAPSCAGPFTLVNCDDNSGGFSMPSLTVVPPVGPATTYYVRVWSNDGTQPGNFNICAIVGCTPANDLPCSAVNLTLGVPVNGDNGCSSGAGEPAIVGGASCWGGAANAINTVWYKFTAPASGSVIIRTRLFTLFDSQIALFSGACGPALVEIACNNDVVAGCGGYLFSYRYSQITSPALIPGNIYYIAVDGRGSNTGSFEIIAIDGTSSFPPVPVQDCALAQTICSNSTFTVADPGYQGIGNYCDVAAPTSCIASGEKASAWYIFSIAAPGGLVQFSINPFNSTDYDFFLFRIDGVANPCAQLAAGNLAAFPFYSCSWTDTYGPTGMSNAIAGTSAANVCTGAIGPAFHPAYTVTGGETFLLYLSNWTNNTSGFTLDWLGTPISGTPPVRYWQNSIDNVWTNNVNWTPTCGGVPDCYTNGIAAVITNVGVAPVISANTSVKDITINLGATLTIGIGVNVDVCGDFTNNGTLVCAANSTIRFVGIANQNINGTFGIGNAFNHFTVQKGSGWVKLNTNIYINGNDSIIGGIVDNNLKNTFLKGNFYNYSGAASFTNMGVGAGGSTLNFTGAAPQNYTNLVSNLTLNNVTMNQTTASTVVLAAGAFNDMILGTGGLLTLTLGIINTGAAQKVDVTNSTAAAVTAGNATSYVENVLRRAIPLALGVYEFPLGITSKGYQRFSLQYTTAPTTVYSLTGKFRLWSPLPAAGPNVTECISANYSCCAPYDNGYWTMDASSVSGWGTYTANAYPLNVTNDIGGAPNGYSIMKSPSNNGLGAWVMQGTCVTPGMGVAPVSRTALNSFSDFGVVQYTSPLPIELLSFEADQDLDGTVLSSWATATEINNDHFEVERSVNGNDNFKNIGTVKGFGAGTTTNNHYYTLRDQDQCNGINYYRIRQVDIDGRFTYSNVVAVRCRNKDDLVSVFPNPSNTKINIGFFETADSKVTIDILDMFGNVVSSSLFAVKKDLNNVEMKIDQLSNGFYYLRFRNTDIGNEATRQVKFLKY